MSTSYKKNIVRQNKLTGMQLILIQSLTLEHMNIEYTHLYSKKLKTMHPKKNGDHN